MLEGDQVDFAQGALAHFARNRGALDLAFIADEMLDGGADPLPLQARDIADRQLGREDGIFRIAFEIAAVGDRAVDIDGWRKQHVRALGFHFVGEGSPNFGDERHIPGGAKGNADREARRLDAADERAAATRAIGTIGDPQLANTEPFDRRNGPEIFA